MPNERIDRLEERVAWFEHHVVQQDKVILELTRRLDRVQAEVARQRERAAEGGSPAPEGPGTSGERPPHY
jgi:SlyX protein